jgi:diketogulonate reductase-like aldo/keto reductase
MAPKTWTQEHFTLNTGAKIPAIGLGTWQSKPGEVREAVKSALQAGYRHIDTALAYGNEKEVGEGIKDSGVPREEIWVTTKLDNPWHKRVEEGITSSLKSLGLDYVDLYLMVSLDTLIVLLANLTEPCSTGHHPPTPKISASTTLTGTSVTPGPSCRSSPSPVA